MTAPIPSPSLQASAHQLGAEYMELVRRTYHPGRSGDLQLVLAPVQQLQLRTRVPAPRAEGSTLEPRIRMAVPRARADGRVVPGVIPVSDSTDRVSLADLAPTTAALMGFSDYSAIDGKVLPGVDTPKKPPKVIVTFVIDGGGWNVLRQWPDAWPNLERLMARERTTATRSPGRPPRSRRAHTQRSGRGRSRRARDHRTQHPRRATTVRKAYGIAGQALPSDILIPTLADRWSDATDNEAWVGEIGYQVWHLGMLGRGGANRSPTTSRSPSTGPRTPSISGSHRIPTCTGCRRASRGSTG